MSAKTQVVEALCKVVSGDLELGGVVEQGGVVLELAGTVFEAVLAVCLAGVVFLDGGFVFLGVEAFGPGDNGAGVHGVAVFDVVGTGTGGTVFSVLSGGNVFHPGFGVCGEGLHVAVA